MGDSRTNNIGEGREISVSLALELFAYKEIKAVSTREAR